MQARALTIWLLRLAIAASLLFPILLFTFAAWSSYRHVQALADERVVRSLDVQQEQALKTFQLIDLTLNNANDLVSGMSDADIRNHEEELHSQLKKLAGAAPVVQSIWIYDKEGRTLVSSWVHPPPEQDLLRSGFFHRPCQGRHWHLLRSGLQLAVRRSAVLYREQATCAGRGVPGRA